MHATNQDLASHYGTTVLPGVVYHPRDKAKVETAVQIVEREILAPLRHTVVHYASIDGRKSARGVQSRTLRLSVWPSGSFEDVIQATRDRIVAVLVFGLFLNVLARNARS